MIFQRWFFLRRAARERGTLSRIISGPVSIFASSTRSSMNMDADLSGIESVFVAGFREFTRMSEQVGADTEAIMQGVQRAMRVAVNREEERLERQPAVSWRRWAPRARTLACLERCGAS